MPFDFLRRKKAAAPPPKKGAPRPAPRPTGASIAFEGLTEDWRLTGRMYIDGRLSDALNKREALPIADVSWAPVDGTAGFSPVPGLRSVDPYDLIVVLAGEGTKPAMSEAEQAARRVQKTAWELSLEAPPLRVVGKVFLQPGMDPKQLLERSVEMFVPVVGGIAYLGDRAITDPTVEAILVNRFYLRGVEENAPLVKKAPPVKKAPADASWPPEPKLQPPPRPPEPKLQPPPKPPEQKAPPELITTPEPKRATEVEKPPGPAKRAPRRPTHPDNRGWPKET